MVIWPIFYFLALFFFSLCHITSKFQEVKRGRSFAFCWQLTHNDSSFTKISVDVTSCHVSEIGLHFMFLGQMIYGCIQQSGMNTRKQIYVLHKNLSLPCNNIHSTHTYTQSLNTHPPTNKANSTWGKCFGFWLAGIYSTTCKLYLRWMEATPKILLRNLISDPIVVWKNMISF